MAAQDSGAPLMKVRPVILEPRPRRFESAEISVVFPQPDDNSHAPRVSRWRLGVGGRGSMDAAADLRAP